MQPLALRPSSQLQDKQQEAPQQLDAPPSPALPGRARLYIALLISLLATLLATCAAAASVWRGSVDVAAVIVLAWCLVILQKVMRGNLGRANSRSRLPVGLAQCAWCSTHVAGGWHNTACTATLPEGCVNERAYRPQLYVEAAEPRSRLTGRACLCSGVAAAAAFCCGVRTPAWHMPHTFTDSPWDALPLYTAPQAVTVNGGMQGRPVAAVPSTTEPEEAAVELPDMSGVWMKVWQTAAPGFSC